MTNDKFCCTLCGDDFMKKRENVEIKIDDNVTLSVFDCENCTAVNYIDVQSFEHID